MRSVSMRHVLTASAGRDVRHRIFFSLYPPVETAERIARLMDRLFETGALGGRRVTRDCLHVTLYGLGGYNSIPRDHIDEVCGAISHLKMCPFDLVLNRMMSFQNTDGSQPRVLTGEDGVYGADALHGAIYAVLTKGNSRRRRAPRLTPHLTLSYEEHVLPDAFIDPLRWRVQDFRLIHSAHGESRHEVLGRWPLVRMRRGECSKDHRPCLNDMRCGSGKPWPGT